MECSKKEDVDGDYYCEICDKEACDTCRMAECQSEDNNCRECVRMISHLLLQQNLKLMHDNTHLMEDNKQLMDENNQLMKKLALL